MSGYFSAIMSDAWSEGGGIGGGSGGGGGGGGGESCGGPGAGAAPLQALEFDVHCGPAPAAAGDAGGGEGGLGAGAEGGYGGDGGDPADAYAAGPAGAGSGVTPEAVSDMLRFLYGLPVHLSHDAAQGGGGGGCGGGTRVGARVGALLATASYFDVPALMQLVSDFVFAGLSVDNCVAYLNCVHGREFGDPGKLIEDASFAFLFRNFADIAPAQLERLPLAHQKRALLANELFVACEFQRYRLALALKRGGRARIEAAARAAARRAAADSRRRIALVAPQRDCRRPLHVAAGS